MTDQFLDRSHLDPHGLLPYISSPQPSRIASAVDGVEEPVSRIIRDAKWHDLADGSGGELSHLDTETLTVFRVYLYEDGSVGLGTGPSARSAYKEAWHRLRVNRYGSREDLIRQLDDLAAGFEAGLRLYTTQHNRIVNLQKRLRRTLRQARRYQQQLASPRRLARQLRQAQVERDSLQVDLDDVRAGMQSLRDVIERYSSRDKGNLTQRLEWLVKTREQLVDATLLTMQYLANSDDVDDDAYQALAAAMGEITNERS